MVVNDELIGESVHKIKLSGRLDVAGVGQIETRFSGLTAAPRKSLIVDLSEVPFLSSLGIRLMLMCAKSVTKRGGRIAVLGPDENVRGVLVDAGIDKLIPIFSALNEAVAAVS